MAVFCFALFPLLRIYSPQRGVTLFEEAGRLVNAWLLIAAAWFSYLFLSKSGADFSRAWSLYLILFGAATHFAFRAGIRLVLRALRRRGYNQRFVVIVGAGRLGQDIARRLALTPWSGLSVRAFYDDDPTLAGTRVEGIEVRGTIDGAARDVATETIDQVWIALPLRADARIRELLLQLRRHSVEVRLVPDIFNFALLNHSMTEVAGLPVINLTESPLSDGNRVIKGAEDFLLSLLLLMVAWPAMLMIAAGREVVVARPGLLRPGTGDMERPPLHDAEISHDAGRRRGGDGTGVDESRRAAGDPLRCISAQDEPGRTAATRQRPEGGYVARWPSPGAAGVRRAIPATDPRLHAKTSRQGWNYRLGAGQRPARGHGPCAPYRIRSVLHRQLVAPVRPAHSLPDPLAHSDQPQRALTADDAPTRSVLRPLLALAAAIVVLLLAYLALAVPASWFPSSSDKQWGARDFTLPRGIGGMVNNELIVTGTDASGQAYVAVTTDLRARDYAAITWNAHDVPANVDVHFLWRTDYAPRKIFSVPVAVEAGRLLPVVLANDAGWLGHVTGIGLAVRGTLPQPFAVSGVVAKPSGAIGILQDRAREWLGFERWKGTSINTIVGGDDVQPLPLPLLLAMAIALALASCCCLAAVPAHVRRHSRCGRESSRSCSSRPGSCSTRAGRGTWRGRSRQTVAQYGGKDWRGKHLAAEDGALFEFVEKARAEMPATPARIFVASEADYFRERAAFHLYPHNVYAEPRKSTNFRHPTASSRATGCWSTNGAACSSIRRPEDFVGTAAHRSRHN